MKGVQEMIRAKTDRSAGNRILVVGLLAVLMMGAGLVLMASSAHAATTFTVTTTSDSGAGSLRQSILDANANPGADTINFNIPSSGVRTIFPRSPLPQITDTVIIDGYSQPGSSGNTLAKGTNAILKIQLDGSSAGASSHGLTLGSGASNSIVKGLVINRFGGAGILIGSGVTGVRGQGNFIGTSASGTLDLGNGLHGVLVRGNSNTIGGTLRFQRNLISGNAEGVALDDGTGSNKVQGNLIGTQKDGTSPLGNDFHGVAVRGTEDNFIGDFSQSGANTIAFNGEDGVFVEVALNSAAGNRILSNSIFSNTELGIDLEGGTENAAGATANDTGDPDQGPNDLQNKPVITTAVRSGGTTTIQGKLNSTPNDGFLLEFYSNPSGNEGKTLIDETTVRTNANGNATFSVTPSQAVAVGQKVTATALHVIDGNSSEFSGPRTVEAQ
jgi:trimeric autotransporter adhesin